MIIVLFRSRLTPEARNGYDEMAQQMSKLARAAPGFIAEKGFTAEDGERLTVVWWQDEETLTKWRTDVQHLVAHHRPLRRPRRGGEGIVDGRDRRHTALFQRFQARAACGRSLRPVRTKGLQCKAEEPQRPAS